MEFLIRLLLHIKIMACKKCNVVIKEQICQLGSFGYFHVGKAIKILENKPRPSRKLSKKELSRLVERGKIDKKSEHLSHVDINVPGILANTDDEKFLLDGHHRATKAQIKRKEFHVFELTPFETGQIFRRDLPKGKTYK
jgi:hypothetical protein